MSANFIVVLVTATNRIEAEKISQKLLEEKLIACANIIDGVVSYFFWQGKIDKSEECIVLMKTRQDLFLEVTKCVKALHSYEVPEVLALPVVDGSHDYLDWLSCSLK